MACPQLDSPARRRPMMQASFLADAGLASCRAAETRQERMLSKLTRQARDQVTQHEDPRDGRPVVGETPLQPRQAVPRPLKAPQRAGMSSPAGQRGSSRGH